MTDGEQMVRMYGMYTMVRYYGKKSTTGTVIIVQDSKKN